MVSPVGVQRLSPRRRSALRLDLEDRQAELITELYVLSQRLLTPLRAREAVPEAWRSNLAAIGTSAEAGSLVGLGMIESRLGDLFSINQALMRLDGADFGLCAVCLEPIDFDTLAVDPTRLECPRCASD
ncbi:MAG TPA: hypothetical protein VLA56_15815 [Pseudomonadales bacterium]|nr:hypothetical protein [Pseudomonadales bacterium]